LWNRFPGNKSNLNDLWKCSVLWGTTYSEAKSTSLQEASHQTRDLHSIASRSYTREEEKHFKCPQFYQTKLKWSKKDYKSGYLSPERATLHHRELMTSLATKVWIHQAGHPGDPHFCINASAGAKGCTQPGIGKEEIKLKSQTPASKPVGSSHHSDSHLW
jgi:hypothetical protein